MVNLVSSAAPRLHILRPHFVRCLAYLMPLLMVSVGAQLTVSTQSVQWYCLLSRNQPESDKPRTCTPVWPRPSSSSATRSTLRRTPVPPALRTETTTCCFERHTGRRKTKSNQVLNVPQQAHAGTYLLPASRRTLALSRPLFSRSFTTSCIISEPMKA